MGSRSILAHRPLSELDLNKANRLLAKDGYKLVDDICTEHSLQINEFFGQNHNNLCNLGLEMQSEEKFSTEILKNLEEHKKKWLQRESQTEFVNQATDITNSLLKSSGKDFSYTSFSCPACGQEAVARIEPDYDYDPEEKTSYVTGVFVDNINCYYCDLKLQDYEELNYVNANSVFEDGRDPV